MTNKSPLTQNQLQALAYFAVGVTSEGSVGGRDVSYRLSFAGNVGHDGAMAPVGNSGYSFGTLQIDLGAHPAVAPQLLEAYQGWAARQADRASLHLGRGEYAAMLTALQRNGHAMKDAGAHDIDRSGLNRFMTSDPGRTFVHGLDARHVSGVTAVDGVVRNGDSALERLQRTALYRDAGDEDQARLAGMFMKLQNQSNELYVPRLLGRITSGELASADDVKTVINGLRRNAANGSADYIESGADNTLRGAALFSTLRSASRGNPLSAAWDGVVANPLLGPVAAHADAGNRALGVQYDTIRSLFLTPEVSQRLVRALDRGAQLTEGDPATHHGRRSAGFSVSGHDFVHWNASGQGVACIAGQWRNVDPDHLRRSVQRDGSIDLTLTENGRTATLLHVGPHARTSGRPHPRPHMPAEAAAPAPHATETGPRRHKSATASPSAVRATEGSAAHQTVDARTFQLALVHLGYTGADGRTLQVDGALGVNSNHAVEQFQRDHSFPTTGRLDEGTRSVLATQERTMASTGHPAHGLYGQSLSAVQALDRSMGIPSGLHTIALAGVAAVEAAQSGLTRVDRVELGNDRSHARVVQFSRGVDDWTTNRTSAPFEVARAVTQPLEVSSQHAARAIESQALVSEQSVRQHAPMRSPVL